jgi:hypothetical protein
MKIFKIEVKLGDNSSSIHKVMAFNTWHAIDLLFYKFGMGKIQPDRTQYKGKNG